MSELAAQLDISKSSLHHVLAALIEVGWVERDPDTKELSLGLRAWEVGHAYQDGKTLSQRAQPFMNAVRDRLGETVRLAVRAGHDNVCIAKSEGRYTLVFDQRVGARLPAHATGLGKALLCGLSTEELAELYTDYEFEAFTESTLTSIEALQADISEARKRGWAEDKGEFILGIRCIAMPVRARSGDVVASISVSVPTNRFTEEHQRSTLELLGAAATSLSERLAGEVTMS